MAVITGITNWSGKVDGLVFYMLNGKQIVRRVPSPRPGPKSAGMKKAKLRNIEFGNAASAGKHLRNALEPECSLIRNKQLHQRVTALMMKLKDFHEAPLGKKTPHEGLKTPQGKACLVPLPFKTAAKDIHG